MVDVIASNRWLTPALAAMELSQMITQGLWDKGRPRPPPLPPGYTSLPSPPGDG